MELAKRIFKYVFILLGVCLAGAVLLIAVMMFAHTKIFGFFYVNEKAVKDIAIATGGEYIAANGTIETINIKTNRFSPDIEYDTDETSTGPIVVRLNYTLQGFGKGDVEHVSFLNDTADGVFDKENKVLNIETVEPEGLFFTKNCKLIITIPATMKINNVNIEMGRAVSVGFNQNAVIKVGNNYKIRQMVLNDLSIKQTAANYKGLTIGKFATWQKKNVNGLVVDSGENISLTVQNLSLDTIAGRVYVNCKVYHNVNIKSETGSIIFKRLATSSQTYSEGVDGNVSITGNFPYVEFGTIESKVIDDAKAGREVNIENQFSIAGELLVDCNATVKVSGKIGGAVGLHKNGSTLIANEINGAYMTAASGTGGITVVGKVEGLVSIGTEEEGLTVNDVFINVCKADINITAVNKPVTINSLSSATPRTCTIKSKRGNVTVKSVTGNYSVNIEAEDGSISVNFTDTNVNGHNLLKTTGSGNIHVTFTDGQRFELVARAKGNERIRIDLVSFNTMDGTAEEYHHVDTGAYDYYDVQINGHTGDARKVELYAQGKGTIYGSYPAES